MLGGPAETRAFVRRAATASGAGRGAAGAFEALGGACEPRGIRTETTAAITAESAPPITTKCERTIGSEEILYPQIEPMRTSRSFAPFDGPTRPRFSMTSTMRAARL